MGKAIVVKGNFKEGEIFLKWLESRLIRNNKNVLGAELGPTGSGKSYRDLRKAELWYEHYFNEKFPIDNICFGIEKLMNKLAKGNLRKGEILIFEEAGANLGSRDFATKINKMLNYVLQSFRSMNIGIFFNLPYLSMLDSQARHLLHYSFESAGIDYKEGLNECKPKFHQVNQDTGKIYKKYPIIKLNDSTRKVQRFAFFKPSQYLINAYEQKKEEYLKELTKKYAQEIEKLNNKGKKVRIPKEKELETYKMRKLDLTYKEIAERLNVSMKTVYNRLEKVKNYLETTKNRGKT